MDFWLFLLLFYAPSIVEGAQDPFNGWLLTSVEVRNLDCEAMTVEGARQQAPARISEASPRGDYFNRRAVICRERIMPPGLRQGRDDAILSQLRHTARGMAALVVELETSPRTWLVESFYPDPSVAYKISFAIKNALLDRDLQVSDRTPTLAAGDLEVIAQLSPPAAYSLACARYYALGSLKPEEALLAILLRDPRETILHAGICSQGKWRWLR